MQCAALTIRSDACHAILQYCEFLRTAMSPSAYTAFLPPIPTLSHDYGFDVEVIFELYRPVLARVEPLEAASAAEEGEIPDALPTLNDDALEAGAHLMLCQV